MNMTLGEIAALVGGTLHGDPELRITGLNGIREAQPGELSFVRGGKYLKYVAQTKASAVLVHDRPAHCPPAAIVVSEPDLAFAQLLQCIEKQHVTHPKGIHPTAVVADSATLGKDVALDAFVRIEEQAVLGDGVVIYAGCYIGRNVKIGPGTILYPNVTIREETEIGARGIVHAGVCLGSDGFGFAPLGGQWVKIPQIGRVIIGDDVEIGSNTAIDRATFGTTQIGQGVKIDNLVQVGHNCEIGDHTVIAGKTGIAGSTTIGKHVRIGPSAGINGHIEIGDGATVGGRAGVTKSVEAGKIVSGFPAMDHNEERRVLVAQQRVPQLLRRVRDLEQRIEALEQIINEQTTNNR